MYEDLLNIKKVIEVLVVIILSLFDSSMVFESNLIILRYFEKHCE